MSLWLIDFIERLTNCMGSNTNKPMWHPYFEKFLLLHPYIHNCSFQSFSQDCGLASHTTHVVCVNFICQWRGTYSLMSPPNNRFFEKLFHGKFYIPPELIPEICWEKAVEKIFFSYFRFVGWLGIRTRALCLISQNTTH